MTMEDNNKAQRKREKSQDTIKEEEKIPQQNEVILLEILKNGAPMDSFESVEKNEKKENLVNMAQERVFELKADSIN